MVGFLHTFFFILYQLSQAIVFDVFVFYGSESVHDILTKVLLFIILFFLQYLEEVYYHFGIIVKYGCHKCLMLGSWFNRRK